MENARTPRLRIETDTEAVERDLSRLVLTLVELIRQLVERQCVRRMEQGDLSDEQVETLGLTLMRLEHPEEAEAQLRKAIELDRSVEWWNYQLAQVLFRQQKYEPCTDALREYIARRPDSSDAWQLLGRCHEALNNIEDAAEAFVRASDAKPEWTWPLLKLSNLRVRSKTNPEQGLIATDRLLETLFHARERAEVYMLRSQLYEVNGQRDKAIDAAVRSTELAPDWQWAERTLARLRAQETRQAGTAKSR